MLPTKRASLLLLLPLLASFFAVPAVAAESTKPVVVAVFPSYDEIISDLKYIGKLSNKPDLADGVEGIVNLFASGLNGMKRDGRSGLILAMENRELQPLVFLPVTKLDDLLASLAAIVGEPEDAGDGIKSLSPPNSGQTYYAKQFEGYAYLARSKEELANLPKDPLKFLNGLDKSYDLGVRVYLQNLPAEIREQAITGLGQGLEGALQPMDGESDEAFEARKKLATAQMERLADMLKDMDQLTIGFSIDEKTKKSFLEFSMTAVEGSKTAKQFAENRVISSSFPGFAQEKALASLIVAQQLEAEDIEQFNQLAGPLKEQAEKRIDDADDLPEDRKATAKKLVSKVFDTLQGTIKTGRMDLAAVATGKGPMTFAFGAYVSEGAAVNATLTELFGEIAKDGHVTVKKNAATINGIAFTEVEFKDVGEDGRKVLGEKPALYFGASKYLVYVAIGDEPASTLKSVMSGNKSASLPPMQLEMSLGAILRTATQANPDNPILGAIVQGLEDSSDDHIRIVVKTIKNGSQTRMEAEEGVIKVIGAAAGLAAQFGAGGF